eukprot:comp22441_c0_seq1/m.55102 comp22441_c0_seq1/g.55102  ORF comp22441_c0_seq1/g.55102 comp22441_c0_seq1/m.55102 type:complete len:494 (-) comp22441_c0_seq1:1575-3056(-)
MERTIIAIRTIISLGTSTVNTGLWRITAIHISRVLTGGPVSIHRTKAPTSRANTSFGTCLTHSVLTKGVWKRTRVRVEERLNHLALGVRAAVQNLKILVSFVQRRSLEHRSNIVIGVAAKRMTLSLHLMPLAPLPLRDPLGLNHTISGEIVALEQARLDKALEEHLERGALGRQVVEGHIEQAVKVASNNGDSAALELQQIRIHKIDDWAGLARDHNQVADGQLVKVAVLALDGDRDIHFLVIVAQVIQDTEKRECLGRLPFARTECDSLAAIANNQLGRVARRDMDRQRLLELALAFHNNKQRILGIVFKHIGALQRKGHRCRFALGRHGPPALAHARRRLAGRRWLQAVAIEPARRTAHHTKHEIALEWRADHPKHGDEKVKPRGRSKRIHRRHRAERFHIRDPLGRRAVHAADGHHLPSTHISKEAPKHSDHGATGKVDHARIETRDHGLRRHIGEMECRRPRPARARRWDHGARNWNICRTRDATVFGV